MIGAIQEAGEGGLGTILPEGGGGAHQCGALMNPLIVAK
jgi:hypothetical protein